MAMDLTAFALVMANAATNMDKVVDQGLTKSAKLIENSAKSAIGTYRFGWQALGPAAIAKHGNTPLLDTGEMQESIETTIGSGEAWVGTNSEHAKYQEFGTSRIPARPFIGGAVVEQEQAVKKEFVVAIGGAFKR